MRTIFNMVPKTSFGRWLKCEIIHNGWSCKNVAEELHITKQSVAYHINGKSKPSYPNVIAYCYLFDQLQNLDRIWKMTEEEL